MYARHAHTSASGRPLSSTPSTLSTRSPIRQLASSADAGELGRMPVTTLLAFTEKPTSCVVRQSCSVVRMTIGSSLAGERGVEAALERLELLSRAPRRLELRSIIFRVRASPSLLRSVIAGAAAGMQLAIYLCLLELRRLTCWGVGKASLES